MFRISIIKAPSMSRLDPSDLISNGHFPTFKPSLYASRVGSRSFTQPAPASKRQPTLTHQVDVAASTLSQFAASPEIHAFSPELSCPGSRSGFLISSFHTFLLSSYFCLLVPFLRILREFISSLLTEFHVMFPSLSLQACLLRRLRHRRARPSRHTCRSFSGRSSPETLRSGHLFSRHRTQVLGRLIFITTLYHSHICFCPFIQARLGI